MNCICCERNKISPNIPPFGGFICIREHLQCSECNDRTAGACGICCGSTSFVQMFYNRQIDSIRLQNSVLPLPTAPSQTLLEDHFMDKEDCSYNFSKSLMNDIDVHSSISQTQLSMAESNDTYSDIVDSPKKHMEPNELTTTNNSTALEGEMPNEVRFSQDENKINSDPILRMPTSLQHLTPKECEQMKTLFFGSNTHNSSSNFTFQFRLENGVMVFDPPVVDHCSSNNEPAVMSVPEKTQKNEEVVVEKMDKVIVNLFCS